MADENLKSWLRQAHADLEAGGIQASQECHRRYWLQQACAKGIKALGLLLWERSSPDDGLFRQHFLYRHSPMKQLAKEVSKDPALRTLRFFLHQLDAELAQIDGNGLLRKVDSTTPSTDPTEVSYRYPFRDAHGKEIAPLDWTATDWDAFQGNAVGVARAVDRLLKAVDNRRKKARSVG